MAPIALVILNPLGFVLMEISKRRDSVQFNSGPVEPAGRKKLLYMIPLIAKSIILNPIVLMTALGIVGNFVFSHQLPVALSGVLKVCTRN